MLTQDKLTYDGYVRADVGVACVISRINIPAVKASKIEVSPQMFAMSVVVTAV